MPRYAAFLRGINVGGHRVSKERFSELFEELGFGSVSTFRSSGNVVFEAPEGGTRALAGRIEEQLEQALGYAVPTFLRSAAQLRAIAAHQPFEPATLAASDGKLQVVMLRKRPNAEARERLLAHSSDEDRLAVEGSELYWLPSGGIRDAALDMKAIDRLAGVNTMRTKGTVELLAEKFFAG